MKRRRGLPRLTLGRRVFFCPWATDCPPPRPPLLLIRYDYARRRGPRWGGCGGLQGTVPCRPFLQKGPARTSALASWEDQPPA
eukprot:266834-Prorocentrum_minimum.AAC.2